MNNLNEINDNINELIMSKSFEHLTEEEKVQALEYAGSEEEYNSLRLTLMAITSSFSEETEEEFAGDDVKTDLMSQFEKKYGSSGNRTKVVPLYRKPYFQLAIAASLALLVFLSVPIFKQAGEEKNMELAKTEQADGKTLADKKGNAASGDNMTVGVNKPDIGSEAVTTPEEETHTVITDETKEQANAPLKQLMDDQQMARRNNGTGKEQLGESVNPGSNAQLERSLKKEKEAALEDLGATVAPSVDNLAQHEKLANESATNSITYNKNSQKKDEVLAAETERKRDDNADLKAKDKVAATTYKSHGTDHTKDHANRMNTMATSGTTGPTSNLSAGAVSFVEQNKNQMMDLLFTVY